MSKMYIMIGIPGCGKSTYIEKHKKETDIVASRDKIRFNLLKDGEEYFSKEEEVYNTFIDMINAAIDSDCDVYVNQTSLSAGSRKKLFNRLKNKPEEIIAIYFNTPLEVAIKRNAQRTGRAFVPEKVIKNMYETLEYPSLKEGFTKIMEVD